MHRKRLGLSQREMAFLLACDTPTAIARHELFETTPNLEMVFAYAFIFKTPASVLFPGVFEDVKRKTLKRIRLLSEKMMRLDYCPSHQRRRAWVEATLLQQLIDNDKRDA